jgi:hypothetical protein
MSNRKIIHVTYAAQLKAAHIEQIEILTGGGRRPYEAIVQFAAAAHFSKEETDSAVAMVRKGWTAAAAAWTVGRAPRSLFAHLPMCGCPVHERSNGRFKDTLIPIAIGNTWRPSRPMLQDFARIQQEARAS